MPKPNTLRVSAIDSASFPAHALISNALMGKYTESGQERLDAAIEKYQRLVHSCQPRQLRELLRPVRDFEQDVCNHVVVLQLIEHQWRRRLPRRPISTLHAAIYGHPGIASPLRATEEVADFDGRPLVHACDVRAALLELDLAARRLTPLFKPAAASQRAAFLAHMLSSIIRIHPFPDGNGRTARLFVQLCLRHWGLPLLALPKVRNDSQWRAALASAIDGDARELETAILRRVNAQQGK